MTIHQYHVLMEDARYRYLLEIGVCIAERTNKNLQALLFQVENYYFEVYFDPDNDKILDSRSFIDTEELHPYLEQIKITNLL